MSLSDDTNTNASPDNNDDADASTPPTATKKKEPAWREFVHKSFKRHVFQDDQTFMYVKGTVTGGCKGNHSKSGPKLTITYRDLETPDEKELSREEAEALSLPTTIVKDVFEMFQNETKFFEWTGPVSNVYGAVRMQIPDSPNYGLKYICEFSNFPDVPILTDNIKGMFIVNPVKDDKDSDVSFEKHFNVDKAILYPHNSDDDHEALELNKKTIRDWLKSSGFDVVARNANNFNDCTHFKIIHRVYVPKSYAHGEYRYLFTIVSKESLQNFAATCGSKTVGLRITDRMKDEYELPDGNDWYYKEEHLNKAIA